MNFHKGCGLLRKKAGEISEQFPSVRDRPHFHYTAFRSRTFRSIRRYSTVHLPQENGTQEFPIVWRYIVQPLFLHHSQTIAQCSRHFRQIRRNTFQYIAMFPGLFYRNEDSPLESPSVAHG